MALILVVDDDKTIRTLLERIALRAGFEVDLAKDGVEALEMLSQKNYDIAIVDLMMPRMSGYELVQQISTMKPRPTVIVATALMNGDVSMLDDSMVRRVIKKPFDIRAVANALVETALELTKERAAAASPAPQVVVVNDKTVQRIAAASETEKQRSEAPADAAPLPPEKPSGS